jgi:hypothetical protein
MLAYLALLCPMIGWQMQVIFNKNKSFVPVIYFLCITELFSLFRFHSEQWHEDASVRPDHYFSQNKGIRQEYLDALQWVKEKGYSNIGIKLSGYNYEYPIWYMLDGPEIHMEHILVENPSMKYADSDYIPDCILGDATLGDTKDSVWVNGILYQKAEQFTENEHLAVYLQVVE